MVATISTVAPSTLSRLTTRSPLSSTQPPVQRTTAFNPRIASQYTGPAAVANVPRSILSVQDRGFVVTFESADQDKKGVFGQRFDANGSAVGAEFQVNTTTAGDQKAATVTALSDGGFVVTFESADQDKKGVFGQRFDANGNAVGAEFQVNTATAGDQKGATVTGLSRSPGKVLMPSVGVSTLVKFSSQGNKEEGFVPLVDGVAPLKGEPSGNKEVQELSGSKEATNANGTDIDSSADVPRLRNGPLSHQQPAKQVFYQAGVSEMVSHLTVKNQLLDLLV